MKIGTNTVGIIRPVLIKPPCHYYFTKEAIIYIALMLYSREIKLEGKFYFGYITRKESRHIAYYPEALSFLVFMITDMVNHGLIPEGSYEIV